MGWQCNGGVLAAYIGFLGGNDPVMRLEFAKHLLAASVMAAPGAIVIAKIYILKPNQLTTKSVFPLTILDPTPLTRFPMELEGIKPPPRLAVCYSFVALIAMCNGILGWIGEWTTLNDCLLPIRFMRAYL